MSIARDIDAAVKVGRDDGHGQGGAAEMSSADSIQAYYRRASDLCAVAMSAAVLRAAAFFCCLPQRVCRNLHRKAYD